MNSPLYSALRARNPWLERPDEQPALLAATLPDPYIPRRRSLPLRPGRAELVVGPRQAGKSTWIRAVLSQMDAPLLILHAEDPLIRELCVSPALALEAIRDVLQPETVLFLEETQNLTDASLFLKGLVDLEPQRRIVATGSSSFALRARTRESLAGRVRRTLLLPFSLPEVTTTAPSGLAPAMVRERHAALWKRLLVTGGYPEPWLEEQPEETLHQLVEAFVLKDVSDLHVLERPAVFRQLLELAAADIGNLINVSDWASLAQVSRGTVARYLAIAEEAHVLRLIRPFVGGKRGEITGAKKVYYLDNGLRNAVFGGFQPLANRADRGALWENAVYGELIKRLPLLDEVLFWRSKNGAEVDFVVRRQDRLVGIEVKAGPLRRPTLSRAARSFLAAYQPICFGVINPTRRRDEEIDGHRVAFLAPTDLDTLLAHLDP